MLKHLDVFGQSLGHRGLDIRTCESKHYDVSDWTDRRGVQRMVVSFTLHTHNKIEIMKLQTICEE